MEDPYIEERVERFVKKYNPKYGDNRVCICGHTYDRHFDSYEDMAPVGCKYCGCSEFVERVLGSPVLKIKCITINPATEDGYRVLEASKLQRCYDCMPTVSESGECVFVCFNFTNSKKEIEAFVSEFYVEASIVESLIVQR